MKLIYTVRKEENIKSNPSIIIYNLNENKKIEKIYEHETDYLGFCTVLLKNNLTEKKNNEINRFARYSSKENKIYYVSFISKNEITLINNIESVTPEKENEIKNSIEIQNNRN